jgi:DNA polymerase-3 subunit gamma/tau
VFENIIEQGAVSQLQEDILGGRLAPSMLFYGPGETGKGSAALETARVLSCENGASWKCSCPSCERHRYLRHDDLLALGKKTFAAEINAYCSVFLHNMAANSAKLLFYRSLRKLQMRFSPVLTEDDSKIGKLSSLLQSFDEKLNEFLLINTGTENGAALEKLCNSLVKDALSLDEEGISDFIPVSQIRRSSYWCRLAPNGKRKTLVIENAGNMRDESRNSLLKLLEEPPANVSIILTAQRRDAVIPTILSRLRPYRFLKRSAESEKEVLRRVFQLQNNFESAEKNSSEAPKSLISEYLDSFHVRSEEKLYPLAAYFIVSFARIASFSVKKNNAQIPRFLTALGERYAPIAGASGFERAVKSADVVKILLAQSGSFEGDSFSRFIKLCLELSAAAAREENDPQFTAFNETLGKYAGEAVTAVDVLNQSPALALEALLYKIKTALLRGKNG